jgi:hypothetical protein
MNMALTVVDGILMMVKVRVCVRDQAVIVMKENMDIHHQVEIYRL